jgi:hypothetical protein
MNHRLAGGTVLRFVQTHGARDVHGSSMLVVLDQVKRVFLVGGMLAPSLGPVEAPALTAAQAVAIVSQRLSPRAAVAAPTLRRVVRDGVSTRIFANTFALPALRSVAPVRAELVTVPTPSGGRTAWRVRLAIANNADYEGGVDATSG